MAFRFEKLRIWQQAREYARKVYAVTARFPRYEDYGLRSQMNRAANSVSLNIAEGSAKSSKAFDYHLQVAVGEVFEVVGATFLSLDQNYITQQEQAELYDDGEQLGKSINAFRNTLS